MGSKKVKSSQQGTKTADQDVSTVVEPAQPHTEDPVFIVSVIAACITFAAVSINLSQLCLSPIYGSVPSALWHWHVVGTSFAVGWTAHLAVRYVAPGSKPGTLLPLAAAWIPFAQWALFPYSAQWGADRGPLITEAATLGPLIALTSATIAERFHQIESAFTTSLPVITAAAVPMVASWGGLCLVRQLAENWLWHRLGSSIMYTRVAMELILVGLQATFFSPAWHVFFILPVVLHSVFMNPHLMSPIGNSLLSRTLLDDGWMLLDRREGFTGYVSVIESLERGFRVMRCDHSLLGGVWVASEEFQVPEPVFGVFAMLEAVRLVEQESIKGSDASALVIGLGIGTTPSAFVSHGIDTVVIEIDPVVHEFAQKYFDLKENNPPVLQDAVSVTSQLAKADTEVKKFEYIVHDVFTGGVEPVDLFTVEFLQSLKDLLKPDGVIAINYAGDIALPGPKIVVRTILSIFPSCRIFRESPPDQQAIEKTGMDFTNMVIFCRKSSSKHVTFRKAQSDDFLGSRAREMFLEPQHEVNIAAYLNGGEDSIMLRQNNTSIMNKWHEASALGHWAVMRTVLPDRVWELW